MEPRPGLICCEPDSFSNPESAAGLWAYMALTASALEGARSGRGPSGLSGISLGVNVCNPGEPRLFAKGL